MKTSLKWLNEALSSKDLVTGMTHYRVQAGTIRATDGRITASHPWPSTKEEFLVPGQEFEKVLGRMPDNQSPTIAVGEDNIKVKSGRFSGTIRTMPLTEWNYPGVDDAKWAKVPTGLLDLLEALRPFISDNAVQQWALCVALENGWAYATNNVAIAGAPCAGLKGISALLPVWAVDFVLGRRHDLLEWAWTENYVAFRWKNKAWMRSQLIVGKFHERAAQLVQAAFKEKPSQKISPEFRAAFERVAELAEDTVTVYADRVVSNFGKAIIEDGIKCQVPKEIGHSLWGAKFLLPALTAADAWSPGVWPEPAPFKGPIVSGYVVGRRA